MKPFKTYHICLSAGDEVYCRCEEDYFRCFNSLALAVAETDSRLLADSLMSTHVHECVRTRTPEWLVTRQRYSYSRYFNNRYGRKGRLGERQPCIVELDGLHHILTAISYVLRNPLHHGVTSTPFGYPYSSVCEYFRKDLHGTALAGAVSDSRAYKYLPYKVRLPDGYHMDGNGMILRNTVIDVSDVEHMFVTPRSFLYYMNRLSGEEWVREQEKDKNGRLPVTIDVVERGVGFQSLTQMLSNEHGRADYNAMSDIRLCTFIDNDIVRKYGKNSVYALSEKEKSEIGNMLWRTYRIPEAQIRRCLAMEYRP